ncbi:MAG: Asp-tRNA(Asn)/Glu-tRNA(Gln) amidotransferase subunit GatB [Eubacteriales bacterium]|jgi:aspartyl-tRNA(Asn)/glutamyl-tRNA(Gln) amidotransferase subunit B
MKNGYVPVIGLETHVELSTKTKIFCSCENRFGAEPNTLCCPVCMGMPGTLPELNEKAVEYAVRAGLALGCKVANVSGFDRKNYFYPDLPKGYQITQHFTPICSEGSLETPDGAVRIARLHLEEDAGKLFHDREDATLIDFNRCGAPLIEIVTYPNIKSPSQAADYISALRGVMLFCRVSDVKMNEGSLRIDANISLHRPGEPLGTKVEIKNINSVKYMEKALEYEILRQTELLESGGIVAAETRRFDEKTGATEPMRTKESAEDYGYFPDPDLAAVILSDEYIGRLRASLPRMPEELKAGFISDFMLSDEAASRLVDSPDTAELFLKSAAGLDITAAGLAANLINSSPAEAVFVRPERLSRLAEMLGSEEITFSVAKALLSELAASDFDPAEAAKERNLTAIRGEELKELAKEAVKSSPKAVKAYLGGKKTAVMAVVGAVMKASGGRADAEKARELIIGIIEKIGETEG